MVKCGRVAFKVPRREDREDTVDLLRLAGQLDERDKAAQRRVQRHFGKVHDLQDGGQRLLVVLLLPAHVVTHVLELELAVVGYEEVCRVGRGAIEVTGLDHRLDSLVGRLGVIEHRDHLARRAISGPVGPILGHTSACVCDRY